MKARYLMLVGLLTLVGCIKKTRNEVPDCVEHTYEIWRARWFYTPALQGFLLRKGWVTRTERVWHSQKFELPEGGRLIGSGKCYDYSWEWDW